MAPATSSHSSWPLTFQRLVTFKHTREMPLSLLLGTPPWLPGKSLPCPLVHTPSLFPTGMVAPTALALPPRWPSLSTQCSHSVSLETEYNQVFFYLVFLPVPLLCPFLGLCLTNHQAEERNQTKHVAVRGTAEMRTAGTHANLTSLLFGGCVCVCVYQFLLFLTKGMRMHWHSWHSIYKAFTSLCSCFMKCFIFTKMETFHNLPEWHCLKVSPWPSTVKPMALLVLSQVLCGSHVL